MVIQSRLAFLAFVLSFPICAATAVATLTVFSAVAQTKADGNEQPTKFQYSVDPTLMTKVRTYRENDGLLHNVAISRDDKGVATVFVEDEIVVGDDPAEIDALVSKYNARVLRKLPST
jgi:hypothetical protein